jgi:hypothetical protein
MICKYIKEIKTLGRLEKKIMKTCEQLNKNYGDAA